MGYFNTDGSPNSDFQNTRFNLSSEETLMWMCVGASLLACVVNAPLAMNPLFKPKPPEDQNLVGVSESDAEIIKRAELGEWVAARDQGY